MKKFIAYNPKVEKPKPVEEVYWISCPSDEEKQIEGTKEVVGTGLAATTAINPIVGGIAEGASAITGGVMEGIGKMADDEDLEKAGNVYKEAPAQPLKEVKEGLEKVFEE